MTELRNWAFGFMGCEVLDFPNDVNDEDLCGVSRAALQTKQNHTVRGVGFA